MIEHGLIQVQIYFVWLVTSVICYRSLPTMLSFSGAAASGFSDMVQEQWVCGKDDLKKLTDETTNVPSQYCNGRPASGSR
jgi:hypothetical protein